MDRAYFDIYQPKQSQIYAEDIPYFPNSEIWGHLGNKFLFILQRLEYQNEILNSIHKEVEKYNERLKKRDSDIKVNGIKPYIEIIHLVSDLRMISDELISLLYILEKHKIDGDYPKKIKISSIGELLTEHKKEESTKLLFFKPFIEFLEDINIVSNSYKHSFINSDILFYKQLNEPIVYAGKNDFNNFDRPRTLISIPLKEIIQKFNKMFKKYKEHIKNHYS
jgi:hypothetical protein